MKYVLGVFCGITALWLLYISGVFGALLVFLIAGVIPGTPLSLPPLVMVGLLLLFFSATMHILKPYTFIDDWRELKKTKQATPQE